jgi:hypothetical protein
MRVRPAARPARAVSRDLVPRCAPLRNGAGHESRPAHACPVEKAPAHSLLPCGTDRGLDHPPEHAPAHVRVRPEPGPRHARDGIRHQPRERAAVLILPAGEAELQPRAQRKPGTIRKKVPERRAPGPAACAQLRHVPGRQVIQRQPACSRQTSDHRRDHRLGQRASAEAGPGGDRLAGRDVRGSVLRGRGLPVAKDPDCRPGHRMPHGMLTNQRRQIALVHGTTLGPTKRAWAAATQVKPTSRMK